ncbi:hypothetical protein G7Y89_g10598 [Cudoniella acicularis]|uniref:O-methyltransferase C-terminal domain-containing protein n=1 Tax=Cudoniella acicularis TaxID=354080 RepID=A0A8H4VYL6_9HELO|nr:hypothetical protein G7Y89_g10598 [Cudoniella acicularis]
MSYSQNEPSYPGLGGYDRYGGYGGTGTFYNPIIRVPTPHSAPERFTGKAMSIERFLYMLEMKCYSLGGKGARVAGSKYDILGGYVKILKSFMRLRDTRHGIRKVEGTNCPTLRGLHPTDCLSLQCIYSYNITNSFPTDKEATFEEISQTCGLNVIDTRPHTAASKLIAENTLIRDFVGIGSEERFQAAAYGFSLGHKTTKGLYEELRDHPSRGHRWANAMSAYASRIPLEPLITKYDWASLGSATIVDVGGGYGPVSIGLAKAFPKPTFIVQDFADVVAEGPAKVPTNISDRISFMAYDMMNPQVVKSADVYFFRAIFHNWTDHYCIKILRNQIPALKDGAKLLIDDSCLHEPGSLPWYLEKRRRTMDLQMLSYFGSRERTLSDWELIFKEADERFEFKNAIELSGEPDPLTRRQLFRKIVKGFEKKDYTLAQAELRIKQLEARVEQLEPRKRRKVRTSPNSKFADIRVIKEAQVAVGDREIDKEDSDSSIESTTTGDCIEVQDS